jgi:hypothetical protein
MKINLTIEIPDEALDQLDWRPESVIDAVKFGLSYAVTYSYRRAQDIKGPMTGEHLATWRSLRKVIQVQT